MILDSSEGLLNFQSTIDSFINSGKQMMELATRTEGDSSPYSDFLQGLRIHVTQSENEVSITNDFWLDIKISKGDIGRFLSLFNGLDDGDHVHWYSTPISVIVSVDDEYDSFN